MIATPPTMEQLADRYQCSTKTVQRMKAAGVDIHSVSAVAVHVVNLRSRPLPMLERLAELTKESPTII